MSKSSVTIPFIRTTYNYDMLAASDESGLKCEDVSLTQQSSKEECDINVILANVARGASLAESSKAPVFGDFTGSANDLHEALNLVCDAQERFDTLPANIRARFYNDPANLLAFLEDGSNLDEAVKLGLVSSSEDLSIDPPAAHQGGKAGGAVEKSAKTSKTSSRASNAPSEGDGGEE